ncbi:unnamed protein product [Arabis nemorensis]|uniref:Poly(A) RNA polymerase mitochondrial-like central palm domain-containing protein n=1 Tax=Arabis nemorensis TaxID=586526 RepID=A0A565BTH9_9BRAS|nr:unnamed protein product [Arabis nemorensis]
MASQSGLSEKYNYISSKGIRKKVKNSESIALKRYKIDNNVLLDLDKVLNDVYSSIRPVSADYDTRKDLVNSLNAMAIDIYGKGKDSSPVLEAYGSFVMDMFSPQSDLDLSINFCKGTSERPRDSKLQILRRFAEKLSSLQGQGYVRNVKSIFGARVPIVRFFDQGTAVECDLSVENKDGILNSQIIRIISKIDDRFQKLCMLVKRWAKAHEVNSALHQTLNSVSITLLVAHHLQTQNPPILPPFSILFKDGIDPPSVEKKTQNFLNWGWRNKASLGRLFTMFFIKLQSVEFLWKQGLCASVLNGLWISKKWKKASIGSISIEDFTDVSQNVARRVNGQGAKKIYGSINRTVEVLFEFLDGKISETHLRHRLFGQQAVVEPSHVPSLNIYPQQPQNNDRIGYIGFLEEHRNKRVCLENGYSAVEGNGHGREDERYENPVGKRNRYVGNCNGFDGTSHGREEERYQNPIGKQNNDRIGYIGLGEEHQNKRVCLENDYRAVEGTGHGREERYENPIGKRNDRIGYIGYIGLGEEHQNKMVCLENDYRAVEGTSHGREEERYENPIGKRNRYAGNCNVFEGTGHGREERYENLVGKRNRYAVISNGFEELHEIRRFGIHNKPLDDPYRQVPLNGHRRHDGRFIDEEPMPTGLRRDRIDPPLPPYGRVPYENFKPQPYSGRPFY